MYEHVVHVDDEPSFVNEIVKGMVHVGLKSGQGVSKPEEHDSGFEEAERGQEGCFPAVFWSNEDIVVSPMDIKFSKDFTVF